MKFKVIVKLNSSKQRLGTKATNQPKVVQKNQSDTAVVDRVKKATGIKAPSSSKGVSVPSGKTRVVQPLDHEPTDYFSNKGLSRAKILHTQESDSLGDIDWDTLNNISSGIHSLTGTIDPVEAREKYSEAKRVVTAKVFGDDTISAKVSAASYKEYKDELSKHSINWVRHEVNVFVYSDDEFPGSTKDENRGIWVLKSSTKSLFTMDFLTPDEVDGIVDSQYDGSGGTIVYGSSNNPKIAEIVNNKLVVRGLRDSETYSDFEGVKLDLSKLK